MAEAIQRSLPTDVVNVQREDLKTIATAREAQLPAEPSNDLQGPGVGKANGIEAHPIAHGNQLAGVSIDNPNEAAVPSDVVNPDANLGELKLNPGQELQNTLGHNKGYSSAPTPTPGTAG